jgi:aldehyde:ferredoxin oxidoreductase
MAELRKKGFYGAMGGQKDSPKWEQGYRKVRNGQDDYWGMDKISKVSEEVLGAYRCGTVSCFSCPVSCKPWMQVQGGPFAVQGEGWWMNSAIAFCTTMDNTHPESALYAHYLCNQLGLDMDNAVQAIAWAFECFQRGLLTREQTDGLELTWGNYEALITLLEKLAAREGFGDFLADGAKRAAERLGRNSETFAIHIKGQDSLDGIRINKAWGFAVVLSPVGGRHLRGGVAGFWQSDQPINSYRGVPEGICQNQFQKAVQDMLGTCSYVYGQSLQDWSALYAGAFGRDLDEKELLHKGRQAHNLEKAFNTIHAGFTRKHDLPPHRYSHEAVASGPYKGEILDPGQWNALLDRYYDLQGWDRRTSLQTREGLEKIGLGDVADRIERTAGF